MDDRCLPVEELTSLAALAEDDPRRRHLAGCPRCRALLASYRSFLDEAAADAVPGAAGAMRALTAALERECAGGAATAPPRDAADEVAAAPPGERIARRRRAAWRPVLAAAAALVVAVGLWQLRPGGDAGEGPPVLRSDGAGASPEIVPLSPRRAAAGGVLLSWRAAVPPVDSYRVVLYDSTLSLVTELSAGSDTQLALAPEDLANYGADGPLFWRVLGLRGGDETIRSGLQLLAPGE